MQLIKDNLEIFKARAAKAGYPFKQEVNVRIDMRGRCAGSALGYDVRLNKDLLVTNEYEIAYETLGHECAHVLQREYFPNSKPHGNEFKFFATILGVSTATTHKMETTPAKVYKRFAYTCACGYDHQLTAIIRNRILKGYNYTCQICNSQLTEAVNNA